MNKSRIIQVFSDVVAPNSSKVFRYKSNGKGKKVTGIMYSNDSQVSISFYNETALEINRLETMLTDSMELPPAKRILTWEQDLKDCVCISGSIKNLSSTQRIINLYLIIEQ